jgi:hypothetical protein
MKFKKKAVTKGILIVAMLALLLSSLVAPLMALLQ